MHIITLMISKVSFKIMTMLAMIHYLSSYLVLSYLEPGAEYLDNFLYFYIVSGSTLGFGDFYPETYYARMFFACYMLMFALPILGYVFGKISYIVSEVSIRKKNGTLMTNLKNHTIIICNSLVDVETLIHNLKHDHRSSQILLISSELDENPFSNDESYFVKGSIDDNKTVENACFSKASHIVIITDDDVDSIGQTMLSQELNDHAKITIVMRNSSKCDMINRQTEPRVKVFKSLDMEILSQQLLDEGTYEFFNLITSNNLDKNIDKVPVTHPADIFTTWTKLMRENKTLVGYVRNGTSYTLESDTEFTTNDELLVIS